MSAENARGGGKAIPNGWNPVKRMFDYGYQKGEKAPSTKATVHSRGATHSVAEIVKKAVTRK